MRTLVWNASLSSWPAGISSTGNDPGLKPSQLDEIEVLPEGKVESAEEKKRDDEKKKKVDKEKKKAAEKKKRKADEKKKAEEKKAEAAEKKTSQGPCQSLQGMSVFDVFYSCRWWSAC